MTQRAVTLLVFLIAVLLIALCIVGLVQGRLEITSVVLALCPVLTALAAGSVWQKTKGGGDPE